MKPSISGLTAVAGVAGSPVRHSLSPVIHNAWLNHAGINAIYVAFAPDPDRFDRFVEGMRGGAVRGLNITAPFKEQALKAADDSSLRARQAGSANLLLFAPDGAISADNTDGEGLLHAFAVQASEFDPAAGPVVILGAGGAARGAAAAFLAAGAPRIDFVNRTLARAEGLARSFGDKARAFPLGDAERAFSDAGAVINATSLGLNGAGGSPAPLERLPGRCVVMDMVYRPVRTPLLLQARRLGLRTVDGLEMLIGQAAPSFSALFGRPPPDIDVRAHALAAMGMAG